MKTNNWLSLSVCLSLLLGYGCADPQPGGDPGPGGEGAPVVAETAWPDGAEFTDDEIGLAEGTVFDSPTPPLAVKQAQEPGETSLLIRAYETSPPRIPHSVAELMTITVDENLCMECHNGTDAKATPPSHMTAAGTVAGARYECDLCHVPQTDAKPLVGNAFPD